jgi:hypothetical protein
MVTTTIDLLNNWHQASGRSQWLPAFLHLGSWAYRGNKLRFASQEGLNDFHRGASVIQRETK